MILRSPRLRGASPGEEAAADELMDGSDDAGSVSSGFPIRRAAYSSVNSSVRIPTTHKLTNTVDTPGVPESRRPWSLQPAPELPSRGRGPAAIDRPQTVARFHRLAARGQL